MAASFRVKALYEYSSPHEDDLNFGIGQIITVTEEEDDEWYCGQYLDDQGIKREGIFPRNFVEKFEPTAPPRPTRARPKKEPEAPQHEDDDNTSIPAPPDPTEKTTIVDETEKESVPTSSSVPPAAERTVPAIPTSAPIKPAPPAAASAKSPTVADASSTSAKPAESSGQKPKPAPPPVSEKPSSNSFKDRIAAFNKPAAPPIAPFKPSSLGGGGGGPSGFVKKSFVAPPPSRDAYIPISREKPPPPTVYRREEDPEIKEQEAETLDQAERAGLVPADQPQQGDDEDQPKPTSLKERIALLQKQQMEQAQRHAEAAAKKEKPKKPQKKKTEAAGPSEDDTADTEGRRSLSTEHIDSAEAESRASIDGLQESGFPNRRRNLKGPIADESHDGNEADMSGAGDTTEGQDDTTEREDGEEASRHARRMPTGSHASAATQHDVRQQAAEQGDEVKEADGEEEDEDDDVDPEARRKAELRARMAKMSGGMGFHGMFGAPMSPVRPASSEKKISKAAETSGIDEEAEDAASNRVAPPVFTPMALPGMGNTLTSSRSRQDKGEANEDEVDDGSIPSSSSKTALPPIPTRVAAKSHNSDDEEDEVTTPAPISGAISVRPDIGPPPIPGGRPPPPSIPKDSARAPPPPPPAELKSPTDGSESDDELSGGAKDKDLEQVGLRSARSPPLSPRVEGSLPSSPPTSSGKRNSRPPPPIPVMTPGLPPAMGRPPPPPPPGQMSRQTTADTVVATPTRPPQAGEEDDEEITEYEGDYDTDIGSSVPHKDALKAHIREPSLEESTIKSPTRDAPPGAPPPIPSAAAPRAIPPPIPSQPPPENKRRSVDAPRAAPPPPPAKDAPSLTQNMDDYDPYNHSATPGPPPMGPNYGIRTPKIDEDYAYFPDAAATAALSSPPERRAPPTAPPARSSNKQSLDLPRRSTSNKRSMDIHRPSVESDFIANDVDLSAQSVWWKQANQVPPVFEGRKDVHIESEETTTTNQGAKTVITRDIFVLFQDYSQTIVTVRFDPYNATDAEMEQRHEPPPRTLRQDQMEEYYDQFGRQISNAANSRKDTVVGDGTPQGLVMELLRPLSGALPPVGTRSYGALVYANMANASTQQQDVIRAGDIISFRNAKFQGKHGPMHAKYSAEVGRPDHVAVVAEWDGTKKKVRAWEQGRENKKIKMESYKLDDLRSGEVKIWRVVPRTWVGWSIQR